MFVGRVIKLISYWTKNSQYRRIRQRRHVSLVAYFETRNPGLKKTGSGLRTLSRSLCHSETCPVRDYSAPVVSWQVETSGAATDLVTNIGLDWIDLDYTFCSTVSIAYGARGLSRLSHQGGDLRSLRGSRVRGRSKFKCDTNVHCVNDKQYIKYRRPLKLTNRKICFLQV